MWPWEHAVVGYLVYSICCHIFYRDSPNGLEAFAVVVAAVLPDLIDKPLAWEYGVFESGYAIGHSIVFAIPLAITVGLLARAWSRPRAGLAVGVGYLLHLPADVLDSYLRGGIVAWELLLWPSATVEGAPTTPPGFRDNFLRLFEGYWAAMTGGDPSTYLLAQVAIAVFTGLLWLADGAPVVTDVLVGVKRVVNVVTGWLASPR